MQFLLSWMVRGCYRSLRDEELDRLARLTRLSALAAVVSFLVALATLLTLPDPLIEAIR